VQPLLRDSSRPESFNPHFPKETNPSISLPHFAPVFRGVLPWRQVSDPGHSWTEWHQIDLPDC
jgi:hypothetical protein